MPRSAEPRFWEEVERQVAASRRPPTRPEPQSPQWEFRRILMADGKDVSGEDTEDAPVVDKARHGT